MYRHLLQRLQVTYGSRVISTAPVMKERCINHAQLLGRVGNEMKLKDYEDGKTRCFFNLATDETYTKQNTDGTESQEVVTTWHNIMAANPNVVKFLSNFVNKGSRVLINGKLRSYRIDNEDGSFTKRFYVYATDVIQLHSPRSETSSRQQEQQDDGEPSVMDEASQHLDNNPEKL